MFTLYNDVLLNLFSPHLESDKYTHNYIYIQTNAHTNLLTSPNRISFIISKYPKSTHTTLKTSLCCFRSRNRMSFLATSFTHKFRNIIAL